MKYCIFLLLFIALISNSQFSIAASQNHYSRGHTAFMAEDYDTAKKELEIAGKQGDRDAQRLLGVMYYEGKGVHQDYHEAFKWWQLAAKQGDEGSQTMLGCMYYEGKGTRQDKLKAKEWFGKACDSGCQTGCDEYRKLNEMGY